MAGQNKDELLRLHEAKTRATEKDKKRDPRGEDPFGEDRESPVFDALAVKQAKRLAEKYGLEKLKKIFPDMAALLE
jgi:hypothetical protein